MLRRDPDNTDPIITLYGVAEPGVNDNGDVFATFDDPGFADDFDSFCAAVEAACLAYTEATGNDSYAIDYVSPYDWHVQACRWFTLRDLRYDMARIVAAHQDATARAMAEQMEDTDD